jgi:phage terminase Nu1 subunit (DNA packaging protein)
MSDPLDLPNEMMEPGRITCHLGGIERLLGVTKQALTDNTKLGNIVRLSRDLYDVVASVQNYTDHLRKRASGRMGRSGTVDAIEEGALLRRAQREMMELKRQQLDGKLISIPDLEELWKAHVTGIKQMILAWHERVAFELPHLTKHDIQVMKRVAEEVLRSNAMQGGMPLPEPPRE